MPGKTPRLNPLQLRKELLVLESEINRLRLVEECASLGDGLGALAEQAKSFSTMAVSAVSFLSGVAEFSRAQSRPASAKRSWLQKLVRGLKLAALVWQVLRARGSEQGKE